MWGNGARQRGLAGFVQYRFVEEDGRPVLYLYEVQVLALLHPRAECSWTANDLVECTDAAVFAPSSAPCMHV